MVLFIKLTILKKGGKERRKRLSRSAQKIESERLCEMRQGQGSIRGDAFYFSDSKFALLRSNSNRAIIQSVAVAFVCFVSCKACLTLSFV